jgi:hypothetical protein
MLGSKLRRDLCCNPTLMRSRSLLLILIAMLAVAGLVAGCGGGGDDNEASSSTDASQLLKDTFSGKKDIKSGKLDVAVSVNAGSQGTFDAKLSGPFESQGNGKLPKLDIDASLEGSGQDIQAGVTSTGDKGFISYNGTDYAVDDATFKQFKAGFEQSTKQASDQNSNQSLATLGIDPNKWLTNTKNEGDAKVGDTDTIKITGDVDVSKLLDDVNSALQKIKSIGGAQAANLPDQLTDADKKQAEDAIKDLSVEIYTGKDDKILRRMVVAMKLAAQNDTADVKLDFQLLDLNEGQDISAPDNAKPLSDLMSQLGGLGLGGLGSGSSSGSGSSGSGGAKNLEKYSQCIQEANGDNTKIAKCADLLTP